MPTNLRDTIEHFAGYHIRPQTGTEVMLFGACHLKAHERCPSSIQLGPTTLLCSCDCHNGIDPAEWDQAYGAPWWAARVDEGE